MPETIRAHSPVQPANRNNRPLRPRHLVQRPSPRNTLANKRIASVPSNMRIHHHHHHHSYPMTPHRPRLDIHHPPFALAHILHPLHLLQRPGPVGSSCLVHECVGYGFVKGIFQGAPSARW